MSKVTAAILALQDALPVLTEKARHNQEVKAHFMEKYGSTDEIVKQYSKLIEEDELAVRLCKQTLAGLQYLDTLI